VKLLAKDVAWVLVTGAHKVVEGVEWLLRKVGV
jgi:hypothetical protein